MLSKVIVCLLLLAGLMSSCATNVTPALIASQKIEDIAVNVFDSLEELIANATGLSEEKKRAILALSKSERGKFLSLMTELRKYIQSAGKIDYKELAEHAFELYLKLRDKL